MTDIVKIIDGLSLLEESVRVSDSELHKSRIKLTPYLIDYCQKYLDAKCRNDLFLLITDFYTKYLASLYKMNRAVDINEYLDGNDL